jgi:hypothetical protein
MSQPLESAVRSVVLAIPAVAALKATMWPKKLPQKPTLPAIVYQRISTVAPLTLSGTLDHGRIRLQLTSWANDYDGARALADAIRGQGPKSATPGLNGYSGTVDGLKIRVAELIDEGDMDEEADLKLEGIRSDYEFRAEEGEAA